MTELFIPIKFKTNVVLKPSEMDSDFENIILKKLKTLYENVCSKYGYIKNNSIKIIKRSIGIIKSQHFNGNVCFDVVCIAEICNPIQGSVIKCKVKAKNSLGLLAEGYYDKIPILEIIIPKISAGIQSEVNLDTISIGQEIKIEVCGKKYQLFDKHISIIGKAIKNKEEFIKTAIIEDADDDITITKDEIEDDIEIFEDDDIIEDEDDESKKMVLDDEDEDELSEGGENGVEEFDDDFIDENDDLPDDDFDDFIEPD
jgi:DNA-directed RNA polymerase subunit E'/Rpb7